MAREAMDILVQVIEEAKTARDTITGESDFENPHISSDPFKRLQLLKQYKRQVSSKSDTSFCVKLGVILLSADGIMTGFVNSAKHLIYMENETNRYFGGLMHKLFTASLYAEKAKAFSALVMLLENFLHDLTIVDLPKKPSNKRLPDDFIAVFRGFLERDYFPTSDEKEHYARKYKLSKQQIDNWLWNNRSRMRKRSVKGPTVDVTPKPTTATPAKSKKKKVMQKGDVKMYCLEDILDVISDIPNLTLTFTDDDADLSSYFDQVSELFPEPPPELFPSFIQELN